MPTAIPSQLATLFWALSCCPEASRNGSIPTTPSSLPRRSPPSPSPAALPLSMEPVCYSKSPVPEEDFFGRRKVAGIHAMAFEPVFEPREDWWIRSDGITFSNANLNAAVDCARKYSTCCGSLEWFHIQVSAVAFDAFYRAMEADHDLTVLLPFWCYCDGGTHKQDRHNHHRHMIAVSPAGHFVPYVWEKIRVPRAQLPDETSHPLQKDRIVTFLQLIDTIAFLSQKVSICVAGQNEHNFFIHRVLPQMFMWSMITVFRNGLESMINDEYARRPIMDLVPVAKWKRNMYMVLIKDLPEMTLNFVIPVSKHFKPSTKRCTKFELYSFGNRKVYFEKDDRVALLPDNEWVKVQAKGGNVFSKIAGDFEWCPTKKQQYYLGIIIPLVKRNQELEKENESLKRGVVSLRKRRKV